MILVFESNGYAARVQMEAARTESVEAYVQAIYESLPQVGGRAALTMLAANGRSAQILDQANQKVDWLMGMLVRIQEDDAPDTDAETLQASVADTDDESVAWWSITPLFPLGSHRLYLVLWFSAILLGSNNRFGEVRRLVRALQVASIIGWKKELNVDYVGDAKGVLRIRRAITLALIQLLTQRFWHLVSVIAIVIIFSIRG